MYPTQSNLTPQQADAGSSFWRDAALPFIESRTVVDGRCVCYARHSHETFSVGLIDSGSSTYINGRQQCRIDAGTLVLMNPGDVHACNPIENQPWAYRMLYLDAGWLADLQAELGLGLQRVSEVLTDTDARSAAAGRVQAPPCSANR